jgi:hypothetical protein
LGFGPNIRSFDARNNGTPKTTKGKTLRRVFELEEVSLGAFSGMSGAVFELVAKAAVNGFAHRLHFSASAKLTRPQD